MTGRYTDGMAGMLGDMGRWKRDLQSDFEICLVVKIKRMKGKWKGKNMKVRRNRADWLNKGRANTTIIGGKNRKIRNGEMW